MIVRGRGDDPKLGLASRFVFGCREPEIADDEQADGRRQVAAVSFGVDGRA